MTERKEWTPRWDGDAPPDWDGGEVHFRHRIDNTWGKANVPKWYTNTFYRYTPKPAEVSPPSERAYQAADKLAGVEGVVMTAAAVKYRAALARFIEESAPELLVDPLEAILREAVQSQEQAVNVVILAAELRERGPAVIAALGEG